MAANHSAKNWATVRVDGFTTRPRSASAIASRQACHASFLVWKPPLVIHGYSPVDGSLSGPRNRYCHFEPRWRTEPFTMLLAREARPSLCRRDRPVVGLEVLRMLRGGKRLRG